MKKTSTRQFKTSVETPLTEDYVNNGESGMRDKVEELDL